ncbi:MAG: thioredoxin [Candidatus Nanopelagicaceae bacterium]
MPAGTLNFAKELHNCREEKQEEKRENMATEKVTSDNFDALVLKSTLPVVVDFWAEWCGPCRAVGPILEEISNEYGTKIKIVKLNTDEEPALAMKYGVSSIPTMSVFQGGEVVKKIIGAKPKPILLRDLEEFIK